jgi:hypothetical protein
MKILFKICLATLLMMATVACQDYMKDPSDLTGIIQTKSNASTLEAFDYYWYKGKKIKIRRLTNKSYLLFRSADRETILSSLHNMGITVNPSKIQEYLCGGTDHSGDAAKSFIGCEWAEVDINDKSALAIPGVLYAAPYYSGSDGYEFPLTNIAYVCLKNPGDIKLLEDISKEHNIGIIGKIPAIPNLYIVACTKESKGNALEIANYLYESNRFKYTDPGFMSARICCTNDFYFQNQWNLENTGQFGSAYYGIDIKYHNAMSLIPSSSNIIVGLVDYGVELTHPDLSVYPFSWDSYSSSSPSSIYSDHGTQMAGIISAITNNTEGVAGIAPVQVMSLSNMFRNGNYILGELAASITTAVNQGASVINNSWVSTQSNTISEAIEYAVNNGRNGLGCVVVFSSGNYYTTGDTLSSSISFPANYTPNDDVIAVGAISYNGQRKTFSSPDGEYSWGSKYGTGLDIVAPGVRIPTTDTSSSYTLYSNGTSAAAAHVSAVAALILSINPNLTYKSVAYIIEQTAQKFPGYIFTYTGTLGGTFNSEVGHGLLNAYAALSATQPVSRTLNLGFSYINGDTGVNADCYGYYGYTLSPHQSQRYQVTNFTGHTFTQSISVDNNHTIELDEEPRGDYTISGEGTSNLEVTYYLSTSGAVVNNLILKFSVN